MRCSLPAVPSAFSLPYSATAAIPIIPAPNGNKIAGQPLDPPMFPIVAALFPLALVAVDTADATALLILLARLLAFGVSVDSADDTEALMLLAKLLPLGTSVLAEPSVLDAAAPSVVLEQNGKHDDDRGARLLERSDEKLDSQLDAAAPVSVVVTPSETATTDWETAVVARVRRASSIEIFMLTCDVD